MEENDSFFRLEQILSIYAFMLVMETKEQNRLALTYPCFLFTSSLFRNFLALILNFEAN